LTGRITFAAVLAGHPMHVRDEGRVRPGRRRVGAAEAKLGFKAVRWRPIFKGRVRDVTEDVLSSSRRRRRSTGCALSPDVDDLGNARVPVLNPWENSQCAANRTAPRASQDQAINGRNALIGLSEKGSRRPILAPRSERAQSDALATTLRRK
jgi:hypothetical protein